MEKYLKFLLPEFIHEIKVKVLVKMFCLIFNEAVKLYISPDYWLNTSQLFYVSLRGPELSMCGANTARDQLGRNERT